MNLITKCYPVYKHNLIQVLPLLLSESEMNHHASHVTPERRRELRCCATVTSFLVPLPVKFPSRKFRPMTYARRNKNRGGKNTRSNVTSHQTDSGLLRILLRC